MVGPPELRFLTYLGVRELLMPGPTPFLLVGQLAACLGEMSTRGGRVALGSSSRYGGELLAAALAAANGNRNLSDGVMAAKLPALLLKCQTDFPRPWLRENFTSRQYADDLETRVSYLFGRAEDRERVVKERIFGVRRTHAQIGALVQLLPTQAEAYAGLKSLVALCLPRRTREPLEDVASELEVELGRSSL